MPPNAPILLFLRWFMVAIVQPIVDGLIALLHKQYGPLEIVVFVIAFYAFALLWATHKGGNSVR